METDEPLYEIFRHHPEWIADLMNDPFPEPGTFRSVTVKKGERRLDGLLIPVNPRKPLRVVEFQFFPSPDVYWRAAEQRLAVHRLYPGREVEAVIFFARRSLDKRPHPWTGIVQAVYLDEEMVILAQRIPAHPLPKLLAPAFEKDETKLESEAPMVYASLGRARGLSAEQRQALRLIYTSLILSRFKKKSLQEITKMLTSLDLTKTRAGKDLIAIGVAEGKAEGKAETLAKILSMRLGKLPGTVISQIDRLDYGQLEKLETVVLEMSNYRELSTWLHKSKRKN